MSHQPNPQEPDSSDTTRRQFLRATAKKVISTAGYVGYAVLLGAAGGCAMEPCTSPGCTYCTACTYCTGCTSGCTPSNCTFCIGSNTW